jgi:hypothetical protein
LDFVLYSILQFFICRAGGSNPYWNPIWKVFNFEFGPTSSAGDQLVYHYSCFVWPYHVFVYNLPIFFICKLRYLLFILDLISNMTYIGYWWLHGYWCAKLSLIYKKLYSKFFVDKSTGGCTYFVRKNNKWYVSFFVLGYLLKRFLTICLH